MPLPTRQLTFGSYTFPLTFQESDRVNALAMDKQKVPFNYGEHIQPNTNSGARTVEIKGAVGSLIQGSLNNFLATAADLEAERRLLAGLQLSGKQQLYVGTGQYLEAYLESFDHKFWQDAFGFRYADWVIKFWAEDPRYFAPTLTTNHSSNTATSGVTTNNINVSTNGNVRTFPTAKFTAGASTVGTGPFIQITNGTVSLKVIFSQLVMSANSVLAIDCDPRPDHRTIAAVYTASGASPSNALQYALVTDFINNYDISEWFPFIDPISGLVWSYGFMNGAGGTYTFDLSFQDRWM